MAAISGTRRPRPDKVLALVAARPDPAIEELRDGIGLAPGDFSPTECLSYCRNAGYSST